MNDDARPTADLLAEAFQLHQKGDAGAAAGLYGDILAREPDNADANHLLGMLLHQMGRSNEGLSYLERAVAIRPRVPMFLNNLGLVLRSVGRLKSAVGAYRALASVEPNTVDPRMILGTLLDELGKTGEAATAFRRAAEIAPDNAAAFGNLGRVLRKQGKLDEAEEAFERAIAIDANFGQALNGLGGVAKDRGDFDRAAEYYRQATAASPAEALFHYNLGSVELDLGDMAAAKGAFSTALALAPDNAEAHHGLAWVLLHTGEFEAGWREYEWRWKIASVAADRREIPCPQWTGQDIAGKRIFVFSEQGFGDVLQFARYLPALVDRGARVVFEAPRQIAPLMAEMADLETVTEWRDGWDGFDFKCPVASLPLAFKTRPDTIPTDAPYLRPSDVRIQYWRERLAELSGFRVGLVWSGRRDHSQNIKRRVPLSALAPLAAIDGVSFVGLQMDNTGDEVPPTGDAPYIDLAPEIGDFADSAGVLANLDLLITVDTSAAHLAGATGTIAWVLLHAAPDWRWGLSGETTPWYPTLQLFRQETAGDWTAPLARAAGRLAELAVGR